MSAREKDFPNMFALRSAVKMKRKRKGQGDGMGWGVINDSGMAPNMHFKELIYSNLFSD